MNRGMTILEFLICVAAITITGALLRLAWLNHNDPEYRAKMATREYNHNYPCINGIRYIRSTGKSDSLTVMIDPSTDKPQHCGAEQQ